jgi:hypothetical protein
MHDARRRAAIHPALSADESAFDCAGMARENAQRLDAACFAVARNKDRDLSNGPSRDRGSLAFLPEVTGAVVLTVPMITID